MRDELLAILGSLELSARLTSLDTCVNQLSQYSSLLLSWGKRLGFSSSRDEQEVLDRHVLDCIYAADQVPVTDKCLDIGSGPGLPGLVMAMVCPATLFVLIEPREKPVQFLKHARMELQIGNVEIMQEPLANLTRESNSIESCSFTARAYSPIAQLLPQLAHKAHSGERLYFLGGLNSKILDHVPTEFRLVATNPYHPIDLNKRLFILQRW